MLPSEAMTPCLDTPDSAGSRRPAPGQSQVGRPGTSSRIRRGRRQWRSTPSRHDKWMSRPILEVWDISAGYTLAGRTHNTAPDLHFYSSEAVLHWCSVVAPTGFEPALPP